MRFLSALFGLLLIIASLIFALSNQQSVTVSLWPFGYEIATPLFIMTLGALAAGLLIGGFFVWLTALPHRFLAKRLSKDVTVLGNRLLELEQELEKYRARDPAAKATPLLAGRKWRFWERFNAGK